MFGQGYDGGYYYDREDRQTRLVQEDYDRIQRARFEEYREPEASNPEDETAARPRRSVVKQWMHDIDEDGTGLAPDDWQEHMTSSEYRNQLMRRNVHE